MKLILVLNKAKKFPEGTVRTWKNGKRVKKVNNKWVEIKHKNKEIKKKTPNYWYSINKLPEHGYVHGGYPDLYRGNTILASKKWSVAESDNYYKGAIWFFEPKKNSKVLDVSDEKVVDMIYDKLISDYKKGVLSKDLDEIIEYADNPEDIKNSINPDDIVDSAEMWDNPSFVEWFCDNFDIDMVETDDGAIIINPKNLNYKRLKRK